jgi:hypothetical protein
VLYYFLPNGIQLGDWQPNTVGHDYDLPPILAPLEGIAHKVSVLTGINNLTAEDEVPGDHARGTGSFLTCTKVRKTSGADIENGISIDQVIAQALGYQTPFPSLQVGVIPGAATGSCQSGYSCAYTRNISWAGPYTPLPNVTEPAILFDRLFGGDPTLTPEEIARRAVLRASILDNVLEDANQLSARLGQHDQLKLDEYLTAVRELETRVQALNGGTCDAGDRPATTLWFPDKVAALTDLMVMAFQCDLTRITTFMLGNAASNQAFDFLGVPRAHHQISHHQGDADNITDLRTIATWEIDQFAALLKALDATDDGDGASVLDNSMIYLSSEIQDGDQHDHRNLPVLLAGGANGEVTPGRHIVYDGDRDMADLFVSTAQYFGVDTSTFGDDGTGPIDQLL